MRYIKFRAYHKKLGLVRDLDFINFSNADFCGVWKTKPPEDLFSVVTTVGDLWNLDDVELMQFAGLTDKNGVGIYEGDIVSAFHSEKSFNLDFAKVEFIGSSFCALDLDKNISFPLDDLDDIEIISSFTKLSATT